LETRKPTRSKSSRMPLPGFQVKLGVVWPALSWPPKAHRFISMPRRPLVQFAAKSVHSFSQYRVRTIDNGQTYNERAARLNGDSALFGQLWQVISVLLPPQPMMQRIPRPSRLLSVSSSVPCQIYFFCLARTLNRLRWNSRKVITTTNRLSDYILGEIVPGRREEDTTEYSNQRLQLNSRPRHHHSSVRWLRLFAWYDNVGTENIYNGRRTHAAAEASYNRDVRSSALELLSSTQQR